MKRVSVIIPIYNAEKSIGKCLDSIVSQLGENDELILINDGSRDKSLDIITEFEKRYSFIKVISKCNEGVAKTRNLGIDVAEGEYLLFIDNDDYIDANYIDTYYNAIINGEYDCVIGGYRRVSESGILFKVIPYPSDWYKLMVVAPWAKIYRTSLLKENNIEFLNYEMGEDTYFSLSLYATTDNIGFIKYAGYNWWYNVESVSNTTQRGFDPNIDLLILLNKLVAITGKEGIYQAYYLRYVVWYLLFSGRAATKEEFYLEYLRYFDWLKSHNIEIKYNIFDNIYKAEPIKNRIIMGTVVQLHKMRLMRLFAKLYCKGITIE